VALFGSAASAPPERPVVSLPLTHPDLIGRIAGSAKRLGYGVVSSAAWSRETRRACAWWTAKIAAGAPWPGRLVLSAVALYGRLAVGPAARRVARGGLDDPDGMGEYHMSVVSKLLVAGGGTDRGPVAVVGPDRVGSVSVAGSVGRRRTIAAGVRSES
jgi:hypothetical protein